jgi:hypothetical protein
MKSQAQGISKVGVFGLSVFKGHFVNTPPLSTVQMLKEVPRIHQLQSILRNFRN